MDIILAEPRPVPAPASGGLGAKVRALLARGNPASDSASPAERPSNARYEEALAVLQGTRVVIQRGWVQDVWYVMRDHDGNLRTLGPGCLSRLEPTEVIQACLVGAVVQAAWQWSPDSASSGPAVDALWETLQENRGLGSAAPVGRVCSPMIRTARIRDLASWNDRPGRTRDDVLELLDQTAARVAEAKAKETAAPPANPGAK
jgi:hypothetical protein